MSKLTTNHRSDVISALLEASESYEAAEEAYADDQPLADEYRQASIDALDLAHALKLEAAGFDAVDSLDALRSRWTEAVQRGQGAITEAFIDWDRGVGPDPTGDEEIILASFVTASVGWPRHLGSHWVPFERVLAESLATFRNHPVTRVPDDEGWTGVRHQQFTEQYLRGTVVAALHKYEAQLKETPFKVSFRTELFVEGIVRADGTVEVTSTTALTPNVSHLSQAELWSVEADRDLTDDEVDAIGNETWPNPQLEG